MTAEKPRRLVGKGLEALIASASTTAAATASSDLQRIPISRIRPNPFQPRREFNKDELSELEASLKASGLLQPITVRRQGDAYELIAGERRFRAAVNLGWTEISAIVRDFGDRDMLVLALVENLQRSDLNAIEEARGYRKLLDDFRLTQQQVAEAVGKDRTTVANLLRLLALPLQVQQMVESGELTTGHAKALLSLGPENSVLGLAKQAAESGITVRQLEQQVRDLLSPPQTTSEPAKRTQQLAGAVPPPPASAVRRVEDDLRRYLQTDVRVHAGVDNKGRIELAFYSTDDLERILDLILREHRRDF